MENVERKKKVQVAVYCNEIDMCIREKENWIEFAFYTRNTLVTLNQFCCCCCPLPSLRDGFLFSVKKKIICFLFIKSDVDITVNVMHNYRI